jgi:hypothetical protein
MSYFKKDESLSSYFENFQRGITHLADISGLDLDLMVEIMSRRCQETNNIRGFVVRNY